LDRSRAHAARRAVHEYGLTGPQPTPAGQREVHRQVVHRQRGSGPKRHAVRNGKHGVPLHRDHLGEPAEPRERGHPVTHPDVRVAGRGPHDPRHLRPGHERQLRLDLVEPPRLQDLGKRNPGRVHVDHDLLAVRLRLVDVVEPNRTRPVQGDDLYRAHHAPSGRTTEASFRAA
jgi:hypothetical protein